MNQQVQPLRWVLPLVMVGLLAWGIFHAVGAFRLDQNPWKAIVVMAFSLAFLGFWALLLRARASRRANQDRRPGSS
jgi:cbb3-type cytochrome oxidase subunit 3